jgi:hypothetical protein
MKWLVRPVGAGISRMMHPACQPDASRKGDFARLPDTIKKSIINQINNALLRQHAHNNIKVIVVNASLSIINTIALP